jgi:pimeloyl-ACP methyl ester carboxylesterase
MSGGFAFPFVEAHPERVAGFVPVAPVRTPEFARRLEGRPVRTLVVWGDRDRVFPPSQADLLVKALPNARKLILEGARHPCYLDAPDRFHEALLGFVEPL